MEPGDIDPRAAAVRETHEEVGVGNDQLDVWGLVSAHEPPRGGMIYSYLGEVDRAARIVPDPAEVAAVMTVPLAQFIEPATIETTSVPALEGVRPMGVTRYERRRRIAGRYSGRDVHYWHLTDGSCFWGLSGELLSQLLRRALDWEPPAPPRAINDRHEFWP